MKGNFKITVIDLNTNIIMLEHTVDEVDFQINRPLVPKYEWGQFQPSGFRQIAPMTVFINASQQPQPEEDYLKTFNCT